VRLSAAVALLMVFLWLPGATAKDPPWNAVRADEDWSPATSFRPPRTVAHVALSLGALQDALQHQGFAADHALRMTCVRGITFDERQLPILMGCQQEGDGVQPLVPDDTVLALRSVLLHHEDPGVSIDPEPRTDEERRNREHGIPAAPDAYEPWGDRQLVDYFGGIDSTRVGFYFFEADYWLKQLAAGKQSVAVPEFLRLSDLIRLSIDQGARLAKRADRFWYHPLPSTPLVTADRRNAILEGSGVQILTEGMHFQQVMTTLGLSYQPPARNVLAESFAAQVTHRYDELCEFQPALGQLRNFFALCEAFELVQDSLDPEKLHYLLHEYHPIDAYTPFEVKTVNVLHHTHRFALRGGVACKFSWPKRIFSRKEDELQALRKSVLEARPREAAIEWEMVAGPPEFSPPVCSDPGGLQTKLARLSTEDMTLFRVVPRSSQDLEVLIGRETFRFSSDQVRSLKSGVPLPLDHRFSRFVRDRDDSALVLYTTGQGDSNLDRAEDFCFAVQRAYPDTRVYRDPFSSKTETAVRSLSGFTVQSLDDVVTLVGTEAWSVTDWKTIQNIREELAEEGMRRIRDVHADRLALWDGGSGKTVVTITGHIDEHLVRFLRALGQAGYFRGNYLVLNTCNSEPTRELVSAINTEYGAVGTFTHEGIVSATQIEDFMLTFAKAVKNGGSQRLVPLLNDCLKRNALNGIWVISRLGSPHLKGRCSASDDRWTTAFASARRQCICVSGWLRDRAQAETGNTPHCPVLHCWKCSAAECVSRHETRVQSLS